MFLIPPPHRLLSAVVATQQRLQPRGRLVLLPLQLRHACCLVAAQLAPQQRLQLRGRLVLLPPQLRHRLFAA